MKIDIEKPDQPARHGIYIRIPQGVQAKLDTHAKRQGFAGGPEYLAHMVAGSLFGPATLDLREPKAETGGAK